MQQKISAARYAEAKVVNRVVLHGNITGIGRMTRRLDYSRVKGLESSVLTCFIELGKSKARAGARIRMIAAGA